MCAALLDKQAVLYFEPESIGSPEGARCGICWKFNGFAGTCVEVEGSISGTHGICGLYVNGEPIGQQIERGPRKVFKREAGYAENGPSHCGNCDEMFVSSVYGMSRCRKVLGMIDGRGCCNLWSKK